MEAHETFHTGLVRTFQIPREFKQMTVLENLMLVPAEQSGERVWASWVHPWRIGPQERAIERQALETLEFLTFTISRTSTPPTSPAARRSCSSSAER